MWEKTRQCSNNNFLFDMKVDESDAPKYILLNQSNRFYEMSETASSILSHLQLLGMFDAG